MHSHWWRLTNWFLVEPVIYHIRNTRQSYRPLDENKQVFGLLSLLALCNPHASRQKRTLSAEGTKLQLTVFRGHAISGRPGPGHVIEATDRQASKLTERTGAEI